jgi:hypothetical protein
MVGTTPLPAALGFGFGLGGIWGLLLGVSKCKGECIVAFGGVLEGLQDGIRYLRLE